MKLLDDMYIFIIKITVCLKEELHLFRERIWKHILNDFGAIKEEVLPFLI